MKSEPLNFAALTRIIGDVVKERRHQIEKHGDEALLPDGTGPDTDFSNFTAMVRNLVDAKTEAHGLTWVLVLFEEVLEASAEDDAAKLRKELIQVAAVAFAWVESIDRRNGE